MKADKYIHTICFKNLILHDCVSSLNSVQLLENILEESLCRLFLMIIYTLTSVLIREILFCYIKEINGTDKNRSRFSDCFSSPIVTELYYHLRIFSTSRLFLFLAFL